MDTEIEYSEMEEIGNDSAIGEEEEISSEESNRIGQGGSEDYMEAVQALARRDFVTASSGGDWTSDVSVFSDSDEGEEGADTLISATK
jgi:hypothetical protein